MRGQRLLFDEFVSPVIEAPRQSRIGRSKHLISQRDERMLYRYYFYTHIIRRNYPDTIKELSIQFDLSELRVAVCIQTNYSRCKEIIQREKPTIRELEKKYSWLNWAA